MNKILMVAYHEAGHAVIGVKYGLPLRRSQINPDGSGLTMFAAGGHPRACAATSLAGLVVEGVVENANARAPDAGLLYLNQHQDIATAKRFLHGKEDFIFIAQQVSKLIFKLWNPIRETAQWLTDHPNNALSFREVDNILRRHGE